MKCFALVLMLAVAQTAWPGISLADDQPQAPAEKAKPRIPLKAKPAVRLLGPGIAVRSVAANNTINLVRNLKVKEEIKLTAEQDAKIQKAFQELSANRRELTVGLRGLDPAARQKKLADIREKIAAQSDAAVKTIKEALKPEQKMRLEQIAFQRQGLSALNQPEVAKKLKLTDEQLEKIAATQQESVEKRKQLFLDLRAGVLARNKLAEATRQLQEQTERKVMKLLTMEQQTRFKDMQGAKFEFGARGLTAFPAGAIKLRIEAKPAN